jgi:hypothetical protein
MTPAKRRRAFTVVQGGKQEPPVVMTSQQLGDLALED